MREITIYIQDRFIRPSDCSNIQLFLSVPGSLSHHKARSLEKTNKSVTRPSKPPDNPNKLQQPIFKSACHSRGILSNPIRLSLIHAFLFSHPTSLSLQLLALVTLLCRNWSRSRTPPCTLDLLGGKIGHSQSQQTSLSQSHPVRKLH